MKQKPQRKRKADSTTADNNNDVQDAATSQNAETSNTSAKNKSNASSVRIPLSTQNARAITTCVECSKPRVVYSCHKLTEGQRTSLAASLSEYDFTCGAPVVQEGHPLNCKVTVRSLDCNQPLEFAFYGAHLGRKDLCGRCGQEGADPMTDLKKRFKTVLPLCKDCQNAGLEAVTQRPFGKQR